MIPPQKHVKVLNFLTETRHIPLSVLVCQDVWKGFLDKLKLKDYIGIVPDGYARDMDADFGELKLRWSEDVVEWQEEKQKEAEGSGFRSRRVLPIVHLTFLCFQKISARFRE